MNRGARQYRALALTLLTLFFAGAPAGAQGYRLLETAPVNSVPGGVLYQGRLEQGGIPYNTGDRASLPMTFKLYECQVDPLNAFNCPSLWEGTYDVKVNQGIFGVALNIPVSALTGGTSKFLEINIQGSKLTPRDQLLSVPYAMVAKTVEGSIEISTGGFSVKNGGSSLLYVSSVTGNVGIGDGAADIAGVRLHVVGGDVMIGDADTSNASGAEDLFIKGRLSVEGASMLNGGIQVSVLGVATGTATGQLFKVGAGTLTVNANGLVGIGTTDPSTTLDIRATTTPGMILDHASYPRLQFTENSNPVMEVGYGANLGRFGTLTAAPLVLTTNGTTRLMVAAGGSVGIMTTSPATTLDVEGDAQFGQGAAKSTFTTAGKLLLAQPLEAAYGGTGMTGTGGAGNLLVSQDGSWLSVAMSSHARIDASGRLSLTNTGVTAGTYGDNSYVAQFTVDAQGRILSAGNVPISGASPVNSALNAGNIWVGDSTNKAQPHPMSGDATLSPTGVLTLLTSGSAGTWHEVTVDARGLVTGHGTPTTLSAYNISDALSNSQTSSQSGYFGDIFLKDDTNPSHYLRLTVGEDYSGDHTLTLRTNGNFDRTLMVGGNATVSGLNTGDQSIVLDNLGDVTGSGTGTFSAYLKPLIPSPQGTYGNATTVPRLTVDDKGRLTSVTPMTVNANGATPVDAYLPPGNLWIGDTNSLAQYNPVSGDATLSPTGVVTLKPMGSAGSSFHEVTVDAQGRVTGHGTPTTLSAYNISDALSNSQTSSQSGYFGDIFLKDDTNPSHYLRLTVGEDYSGDHTLTLRTNGNFDRTLMLDGDATVSGRNTGDQSIVLDNLGDVTGSGTGTFSAYLKNNVMASPNTYGNGSTVPQITVNSKGLVTAVTPIAISGVSPVGASLASGKIWIGSGTGAQPQSIGNHATLAADGTLSLVTYGPGSGTYYSVTVDATGRVQSGTALPSPAYVDTYGITDAVKLQAATPGTQQTGHLNINGNAIFGGDAMIGGAMTITGDLSINGTGGTGNVPHNCARVSAGSGGSDTASVGCGVRDWAVGGGGICSLGHIVESRPDANSPPAGWVLQCSVAGSHTVYAVCCYR